LPTSALLLHLPLELGMTAREAWLAVALMVVALLVAMTIAGAVAEFVAPAIQEEITWTQK